MNVFNQVLKRFRRESEERPTAPERDRIGISTSDLLSIYAPYDPNFTARKRAELKKNPYIYTALRNTREELVAKWYGAGDYERTSELDANLERQQQILAASRLPIHEAQANHLRWNIDNRLKRGWSDVIRQLDYAREDGKSVLEIMWAWQTTGPYRGTWVIDDLIHCDPDCFRFTSTPQTDSISGAQVYTRQMLYDRNGGWRGQPVPYGKFLVLSFDEERELGDGRSILQYLSLFDWYQRNNFIFWMVHLNRYGSPAIVGKYPKGSGQKVVDRLIATIRSFQQETGIVIPDDQQVEILQAQQRDGSGFEKLNDIIVKIIAEVITGNAMSLEIQQVGSFAATKATTAEIRTILLYARAVMIDTVINRQLIPYFMWFNYPDEQSFPRQQILPPRAEDIYNPASSAESIVMRKTFAAEKKTEPADDLDGLYAHALTEGLDIFQRVWVQPLLDKIKRAETPEAVQQIFMLPGDYAWAEYADFLHRLFLRAYGLGIWRVYRQIDPAKAFAQTEPTPDIDYLEVAVDIEVIRAILLSKGLMTKAEFDRLSDQLKRQAATLAEKENAEIQKYIRPMIVAAIGQGLTLRELEQSAHVAFNAYGITEEAPYRAAIVLRTNAESEFHDAMWRAIHQPDILANLALLEYVTENDARVRPNHRLMHGIRRPVNDPVWQIWWPPNGYNCRCRIKIISAQEAEREGLLPSPDIPNVMPDEGFASGPSS